MKKNVSMIFIFGLLNTICFGQNEQKFSAVNPALFLYETQDVFIKPPNKYNSGSHIISPNPTQYPWEARLENGMPNILKDSHGNIAIYISSFISFAAKPPSKVGVIAYTNNTDNVTSWTRPDAGLYWYNPNGTTADEKISPIFQTGFQATNIVATDIESVGIYDDTDMGVNKPIKFIYLPQRESFNKMVAGYEMDKTVTDKGIFTGFSLMKNDRLNTQKKFTFKFINGDTHMNYLKQNGEYYFVSRLNSKRSALLPSEHLPLRPDNRARYRRETITKIGNTLTSKNVDFNIALDMSTHQWEPYSMQPFKMDGFDKDIWWGLVTMFGAENDTDVKHRQRTELAVSNDGVNWRYLKQGVPFLDNGSNPLSDDHGCINIGKPITNTKFSNSTDMYYFYAASKERHVAGRNPGISLAIGKYGKMAGLSSVQGSQNGFYSMSPVIVPVSVDDMLTFSFYESFKLGSDFVPYILADVTEDPSGKTPEQLSAWVRLSMYSFLPTSQFGKGIFLGGAYGSAASGTQTVSDDYERKPFQHEGVNSLSKENLLKYLRHYSTLHPTEIVSIKDFPEIPVVMECLVKDAVFYGLKFNTVSASSCPINVSSATNYEGGRVWDYTPSPTTTGCHTEYFLSKKRLPNQKLPVEKETGSLALKLTPASTNQGQCLMRMYGTERDNLGLYYSSSAGFTYKLVKDGMSFAEMGIQAPQGNNFDNKECVITLEAVKNADRKYATTLQEEALIFRVSCPSISVNSVIQQPILWNWKHDAAHVTPADSANARAFAYLEFSAFVAGMDKITIGAKDEQCSDRFTGIIGKLEIADKLPSGASDFWGQPTNTFRAEASEQNAENTINQPEDLLRVSVYPNPVREGENTEMHISSSKRQRAVIQLYGISGNFIRKWEHMLQANQENTIAIDLSSLSAGMYVAPVQTADKTISTKIIKK